MNFHWYYIVIWIICGITHGYINRNVGGWLIMITDSRNTHQTWMTLPSLLLCWILWPIGGWIARKLFMLCRFMDAVYYHFKDKSHVR
jgi:hypothetical protein